MLIQPHYHSAKMESDVLLTTAARLLLSSVRPGLIDMLNSVDLFVTELLLLWG